MECKNCSGKMFHPGGDAIEWACSWCGHVEWFAEWLAQHPRNPTGHLAQEEEMQFGKRVFHKEFGYGSCPRTDDGNIVVDFDVPTNGYKVRSLQSGNVVLVDAQQSFAADSSVCPG